MPLTVREAAKKLGVSPGTIYGLCAGGRLRHHRIGLGRGVIRIDAEEVERYYAEALVHTPSEAPLVLKHITLPTKG
jgi:excisionase family DNA binding protein